MTNEIKVAFYAQILMPSILITSCNGQTKTAQEKVTEIKPGLTEPAKLQEEIRIDTSRETKLDFSKIAGNFDKVYSNVHNGFQDKAGNIWFSTTGAGAIRFDGKLFAHITTTDKLDNNSITPLLEDKERNIWFASADCIYRYDGKIFTNIPTISANNTVQTPTLNAPAKGTSISVISAMQDKKGTIWFGTETSGVDCYDGQNLTNFLLKKM